MSLHNSLRTTGPRSTPTPPQTLHRCGGSTTWMSPQPFSSISGPWRRWRAAWLGCAPPVAGGHRATEGCDRPLPWWWTATPFRTTSIVVVLLHLSRRQAIGICFEADGIKSLWSNALCLGIGSSRGWCTGQLRRRWRGWCLWIGSKDGTSSDGSQPHRQAEEASFLDHVLAPLLRFVL